MKTTRSLYAHPLLISYLFRDITYHLDPVLSASQPHGSGTSSLSAFAKPSHFLLLNAILRLTFSSQLTPPPSDLPSNVPWFFDRLWRCVSFVLTYLLTDRRTPRDGKGIARVKIYLWSNFSHYLFNVYTCFSYVIFCFAGSCEYVMIVLQLRLVSLLLCLPLAWYIASASPRGQLFPQPIFFL